MRPPGEPFETIQASCRLLLHRLYQAPPPKLFHYTSAEGLHGILSSGQLRGSNYVFMNDRSEFTYGATLLREIVETRSRTPTDDVDQDYYDAILGDATPIVSDLYLACFCTEGDLLSQWRGYGRRGSRYCLRFAADEFERLNDASQPLPVCYDEATQRTLLNDLLDEHLTGIRAVERVHHESNIFALAASCTYACCIVAFALFKDFSFHEEQEWRSILIARPGDYVDRLQFWSSGGVMKPSLPLLAGPTGGKLPIREILCGASAMPDQSIRSAKLMLARYAYPPIDVKPSRIPLSG